MESLRAANDHSPSGYPMRKSFHAHRVTRLMMKTCEAQHIGPEAMLLVIAIAHTEDARRYKPPGVTYYNGQLAPICGFSSHGRLKRAREKAVAAGWLHYEKGGKGIPGLYWTLIPDHIADMDDGPIDEEPAGLTTVCTSKMDVQTTEKRQTTDGEATEKRRTNARLSSLYPNPIPTPIPEEGESASADPPAVELIDGMEVELTRLWNDVEGICHVRFPLSEKRRRLLRTRMKEPAFRDGWRDAIDRIAASSFCRGETDRGDWRATFDWFLRPDSVPKILEGQYDNRCRNGRHAGLKAFLEGRT